MKEKLQKTKVASESLTSVPTTGPQTKNFVKKKTDTDKKKSVGASDTVSITTEKSVTSTNIYKPNLRKGTASATSKPVKQTSKSKER